MCEKCEYADEGEECELMKLGLPCCKLSEMLEET